MKWRMFATSLSLFALACASRPLAAQVTAEKSENGVVVKIDGALFTEYLVDSGGKPILWPILGPTGQPMTRAFPMAKGIESERTDHPHQRSFWFTHGDVNGLSYWHKEVTRHREFKRVASGDTATIVAVTDWLAPDGKKLLEDERTLVFGKHGQDRYIDFTITLKATEGRVTFGDTKEGTFGVRVAGTMKVDAKPGGTIVNSEGQTNADAWGQPAAWVDYHGPVNGETVGIAIMNHPSSFRFPTHWHVRTYGLFAANPFGLGDFPSPAKDGKHVLEPGDDLLLRYRVLFHRGDTKDADIAGAFAVYEKQ